MTWPSSNIWDWDFINGGMVYLVGIAAIPILIALGSAIMPHITGGVSFLTRIFGAFGAGYERGFLGSVEEEGYQKGRFSGGSYAAEHGDAMLKHWQDDSGFSYDYDD